MRDVVSKDVEAEVLIEKAIEEGMMTEEENPGIMTEGSMIEGTMREGTMREGITETLMIKMKGNLELKLFTIVLFF